MFHMYDPEHMWNDSGHNFLVCRNGLILQGRWRSISFIQDKKMVLSAHCVGQNYQIGVEHEHISGEHMPAVQREASAKLMAWIATCYELTSVLPIDPHSKYNNTRCPDNLISEIPLVKSRANKILDKHLEI